MEDTDYGSNPRGGRQGGLQADIRYHPASVLYGRPQLGGRIDKAAGWGDEGVCGDCGPGWWVGEGHGRAREGTGVAHGRCTSGTRVPNMRLADLVLLYRAFPACMAVPAIANPA